VPRARRADVLVLAGLLTTVLLLFRGAVFGGLVFYYRDVHILWHPQVEAFVRAVAGGAWPLWNPSFAFGTPLLANPNSQVLYPFTWLNLVLRPWHVYTIYVVGHVLMAAAGMYVLSRRLGTSRPGSALAAGAWAASGPLISLSSLWNHLAGAALLPWMLWLGVRAIDAPGVRSAVTWGASIALAVLAGSPEMALLAHLAAAGYAAGADTPWRSRGAVLAGSGAVALLLSAAQWLPSLQLAHESVRWTQGAGQRAFWSVPPALLLSSLVPALPHDLPLRHEVRQALLEGREPYLASLHLGGTVLALALAALVSRRGRVERWLAAVAVVALLVALGRHTFVHGAAETVVPLLRLVRYPVKAMVLVAACVALLAGRGVDAWRASGAAALRPALLLLAAAQVGTVAAALAVPHVLTESLLDTVRMPADVWRPAAAASVAAGLALLVALAAATARPTTVAVAVLVAAGVGEVAWAHRDLTPLAPRELLSQRSPVADVVGGGGGRVYAYDYFVGDAGWRRLGHGPWVLEQPRHLWPAPWVEAFALRQYLYPTLLGLSGLKGSFDADQLQLDSPAAAAVNDVLRAAEGSPAHTRLLQLGAVSGVISLHGIAGLTPVARFTSPLVEPVLVSRVPDPLPRAYAVGAARAAGGVDAMAILLADDFDPRQGVVVPPGSPLPAGGPFEGEASVVDERADRVRLRARLSRDGYVVLVDAFRPGWRATVDGQEAPVLPANLLFRAVPVPAGSHEVELVYRPRGVAVGGLLSLASLVGVVVLLIRDVSGGGRHVTGRAEV
jgi:hypothetical protein